jgi:hypothetical protein
MKRIAATSNAQTIKVEDVRREFKPLLMPIHRPLYIITDDVVDPVGGDDEDPVCVLRSRRYLKRLVLSQLLRDLREGLLGFVQAFVDPIHHASEGWWLVNARSGTGSLGAPRGGALHRLLLVGLLAGINQPYHHAISHMLSSSSFAQG